MNSFKKVSLVIAAALTGTVLATVPAHAVPTIAVTVSTVADNDANTLAGAAVVTVPSDNKINAADAVKFALTGVDTGTVVSVVTSNAFIVSALWDAAAPVTSASGVTSYSVSTGTGTTAEFYVYTKSTATGTVTITNAGNVYVYYVKGTAGTAYNLDTTVATNANTSAVVEYSTKVTDVFGNIPSVAATPVVTVIGATVSVASAAFDATTGISKVTVTYPATAGNAAINFAITATDVDGLPVAAKSVTKFVTVSDLATANASLTAQLAASIASRVADAATSAAALTKAAADLAAEKAGRAADKAAADLAAAAAKASADAAAAKALTDAAAAKAASDVATAAAAAKYKSEFNALATKWNKANPKAKVALKK
jgi:hypothetical protein